MIETAAIIVHISILEEKLDKILPKKMIGILGREAADSGDQKAWEVVSYAMSALEMMQKARMAAENSDIARAKSHLKMADMCLDYVTEYQLDLKGIQ